MNKYLTILCLLFLPLTVFSGESDKLQLTDEQLAGFKAAEERYKDNPAKMKIINQFKEKLGITDEPVIKEPPPPPPPKHITTTEGSMDSANAAYAKGDYATALEQYKAMAAQGNPEANIYVGMMYEAGMGVEEPDIVTADAWYRRAAVSADPDDKIYSSLLNQKTVLSYERNRMSADEATQAGVINQEINSEIARVRGEEPSEYQPVEFSDADTRSIATGGYSSSEFKHDRPIAHSMPEKASILNMKDQAARNILYKPEKFKSQYSKPESHTKHQYPEKFIRDQELNTIEKS